MRTFFLLCLVTLIVVFGFALAVGFVTMTGEHLDGRYVATVVVHTDMLHHRSEGVSSNDELPSPDLLDVKGKITAVRAEQNEFVIAEGVKNWTFQLAGDSKIYINGHVSKLTDLKAGDEAVVSYDRIGQQLIANAVRCKRK